MDGDLEAQIRAIALKNAADHGGQTRDGTVLGKILGARPELRASIDRARADVARIVAEVNGLTPGQQRDEIARLSPEVPGPGKAAAQKATTTTAALPELEGAERGKVVTRFPPEPNGYPHIGHAKAAIINLEYARMYGGRCILRLDDTNPETERMEYHAAIKVGLEWLGTDFDVIKSTSDDMDLLYEKGGALLGSGSAYVCTCSKDRISRNRRERKECKCRGRDADRGLADWARMTAGDKFKPGDAIVRFRGDMGADNAVMRDPVLFRIIHEKHYRLADRYKVWPSYDMAVAVEDSADGITHAFRSKEFELRADLIDAILDALHMRKPRQGFFSRLEFKGMPISKRIIRPLIDEGRVSWYDDPRLPTLEALRRRGIVPEAIRRFILSLGLTKADTLAPFDALEAFNRRVIDATSIRLFMVSDPVALTVRGLPAASVELPCHPSNAALGGRTVGVDGSFYIPGDDARALGQGARVRLVGLGDVLVTGRGAGIDAVYAEDGGGGGSPGSSTAVPAPTTTITTAATPKIQWVPQKTAHRIKLIIPRTLFNGEEFNEDSLEELAALVEPHYLQLKDGQGIQFVRFGYCRKDSKNQAIFTHK